MSRLKRVLAEQGSGSGFFHRGLAKSRGATSAERQSWCAGIYAQIRDVMSRQGQLSIERMCQLAQVSRAGFCRSLQAHQPMEEDPAMLLDGFSRKGMGWALENRLASRLPIRALRHALATRQPPPGLVHHSDRGVQYASGEYVPIPSTTPDDPEHEPTGEPV